MAELSNLEKLTGDVPSKLSELKISSVKTSVVRIRRTGGEVVQDCDIYIGRAMYMGGWKLPKSKWANPFTVKECGNSSTVAVQKYRAWLLQQPELLKQLPELKGKVLGCWCKNKPEDPCHGDVLVEFVEKGIRVL